MEKRTILAVGLIILVIGLYNLIVIPRFNPPPPAPAPVPAERAAAPAPAAPAAVPVAVPVATTQVSPAAASAPVAVPAVPPEEVRIDRRLYSAAFSNVGGGLESWQLKSYTYGKGSKDAGGAPIAGKPLELVRPGQEGAGLLFTFTDPQTQAGFTAPMQVTRTADGFTLQAADAQGLRVTRTYRFSGDACTMEVLVSIENLGDAPRPASWEVAWGPGIDRNLPEKERAEEVADVFVGGKVDTVKAKKPGDRHDVGPVTWVGIGNRYFLAALLPKEGALAAFVRRRTAAGEEIGLRSEVAALGPRQAVTYRVAAYLGPKERGQLSAAGSGLERSVNYGWFSWLALPFLAVLQFCFRFLRSYGIAILALTLIVKAALFPISLKMFRSMKKMQELAPKLQALKAKFKNDSQALQQATMGLYKEHKVNPMAGCLPMVIQIPVFFALYRVLYNAIELRGAGFLYIPDLSQKDPYYITPILMGVTMLIQQRMTPTVGDPAQARMMMFMPVIFTAMFINFSSGLVLYFLFSNLLSIGEQRVFRMLGAREQKGQAPEAPAPAARKKR